LENGLANLVTVLLAGHDLERNLVPFDDTLQNRRRAVIEIYLAGQRRPLLRELERKVEDLVAAAGGRAAEPDSGRHRRAKRHRAYDELGEQLTHGALLEVRWCCQQSVPPAFRTRPASRRTDSRAASPRCTCGAGPNRYGRRLRRPGRSGVGAGCA